MPYYGNYFDANGNALSNPSPGATAYDAQGNPITVTAGNAAPAGATAASVSGAPVASAQPYTPPAYGAGSQTPGYAPGSGETTQYGQSPGALGTGTYVAPLYPIQNGAITGAPSQGASQDYGLNQVWNNLNSAIGQVPGQGAPMVGASQLGPAYQFNAAQMAPAQGQAAQGQAANGTASAWQTALGQAASAGPAYSGPAQGAATYGNAAQLYGSAHGGYATTGQTPISTAGDLTWQGQQQTLANQLQRQANGQGPSVAGTMLQQGEQQQVANQLAVLGSQRGSQNAGLAQRSAADQGAAAQANLAGQMALAREQEQLNAQGSLGNVLGTARSQAQNYNINQAGLNQNVNLANLGNAQAANMQNAGFGQQVGLADLQAQQQTMLANQQAALGTTTMNVGNAQQSNLSNAQMLQNAGQFNANLAQNMTGQNLSNLNAANQGNAQLSQQMGLANLGNNQAMNLANMNAQNTFGLANLGNAQQANVGNMGAVNQFNAANQGALNQYGLQQGAYNQQTMLANQQQAYANQQMQNQQLDALLGAQTGIGQSNRAAQLAAQQLQVQQMNSANQTNEQAYQASANANAGLAGTIFNAGAGILGAGIGALKSNFSNGSSANPNINADGSYNYANMADQASQYDANGNPIGGAVDTSGGGDLSAGSSLSGTDYSTGGYVGANPFYSQQQPMPYQPYAYSDENLKTGIDGGNPMMASFLKSFRATDGAKEPAINVNEGSNFRNPVYAKTTTPGHSDAGGMGPPGWWSAGVSAIPIVGGLFNAFASGTANNGTNNVTPATTTSTMVDPGSGNTFVNDEQQAPADNSLDPNWSALSDDQAKENVMSGNRGMQSFLEQQGAQQQAQGQLGATNNAFMQTGQAPNPKVDRQMPSANAGYGAPVAPLYTPGFQGYEGMAQGINPGGIYGGGVTDSGGYGGGGYNTGGVTSGGGWEQANGNAQLGGITQDASVNPGGLTTQGGQFAGGNPGAYAPSSPAPQQPRQPTPMYPMPGQGLTAGNGVVGQMPYQSGYGVIGFPGLYPNVNSPTNQGPQLNELGTGQPMLGQTSARYSLSDEDEKTETRPVGDMLDQLAAYQYRYKDPSMPGAAPGRHVGVMAQDLERSPLGATMVENTPQGKRVNYGQALGTMMAGQAYLNERLNEHEKMLRGR
jgi:hypothetical protein